MRSPTIVRLPAWRLTLWISALLGCCLGFALLHAGTARAFIVDASGHRYGVTLRGGASAPGTVAPQAQAAPLYWGGDEDGNGTTTSTQTANSSATIDHSSATHVTTSSSTQTGTVTVSDGGTTTESTVTSTASDSATTTATSTTTTQTTSDSTSASSTTTAYLPMQWHGGPVIRNHQTYAIYWDPQAGFPAGFEGGVDQYFHDVAGASGSASNVYSVLTQYSDASGPGVYQSTFGGAYVDTNAYPTDDGTTGCPASTALPSGYSWCVSDAQVKAELQSIINQNGWPSSTSAIYYVFLPPGIDECFAGSDGNEFSAGCADNEFCSYHSYFGSGQAPLYAVLPWADVPGCQTGYSPNGTGGDDPLDDQLSLVAHEDSEAITDPFGTSWYDASGNEVADDCTNPDAFGTLAGPDPDEYNQLISGDQYILQQNFSNDGGSCRSAYMARFNAPTKPVMAHPVVFSAIAPKGTPGVASYQWDFGDGTTSAGAAAWHTYTAPGQYTVTLTTTASDGTVDAVSHTIAVSTVLSQFNAPAHAQADEPAAFDGSPSLGNVISYSWNFGDGSSGTGISPAHTYQAAGTYTVTLTVSDKVGNTDTSSQIVNVGAFTPNTLASNPSQPTAQQSSSGSPPPATTAPSPATTSSPSTGGDQPTTGSTPGTAVTQQPAAVLARATIARAAAATVRVKGGATIADTGRNVMCPTSAGTCTVAVTLIHVASGRGAHNSITLAAQRVSIAPGASARMTLRLGGEGVTLLHSAGHLKAVLELVVGVDGGASTTRILPIMLNAPAKHAR
jgi:hypothetical protein